MVAEGTGMLVRLTSAIIALFLSTSPWPSSAVADDLVANHQSKTPNLTWHTAFRSDSLPPSNNAVRLMLITDGEPAAEVSSDDPRTPEPLQTPWCNAVFAKSVGRLYEQRPDLRSRLTMQHLSAGVPKRLNGGKESTLPNRAMLVVLDSRYRLLAWMVGVPDSAALVTLIEDAEEAHLMNHRFKDDLSQLRTEIAKRSIARLDRRWANALDEQWQMMSDRAKSGVDSDSQEQELQQNIALLASVFRRVYVNDVALRFGLSDNLDRRRLAILEQHPQARRPWCESLIPFVVGVDFHTAWRPMVESVWNRYCVSNIDDATEFLSWWDNVPTDQPVVLALRPPLLETNRVWPPAPQNNASRRGLGWDTLQTLLTTKTYREVMAYELVGLMQDRQMKPINVHDPSRLRYLYFESTDDPPVLIREGDVPARHVALVRRNKH
tara:strand:- start:76067 stop:77374 length:1308 start_codon:yes stop_codon:yes gene_type:complete